MLPTCGRGAYQTVCKELRLALQTIRGGNIVARAHYCTMNNPRDTIPVTLFESKGVEGNGMYSFAMGAPGHEALRSCAQLMEKATRLRMQEAEESGDARFMQYGSPAGDPRFINALAKFLSHEYLDTVHPGELVTTAGASSGLMYTLNMVFPDKCRIFCEELTYHIAINVLKHLNFSISSVPMDDEGIDVEALDRVLSESLVGVKENEWGFKALLYMVPTFHNPTGTVLSQERSRNVITLARKHRILVLCDDVYNILHCTGMSPKRLFAYDNKSDSDYQGNVISNGSFSKLLSPGLRLGWMEIPLWFHKLWCSSAFVDSGGSLNMYASSIVSVALEDGSVAAFVNRTRENLKRRFDVVTNILADDSGNLCKFKKPQGGYFLWIKLPTEIKTTELLKYSMENYKIQFSEGFRFVSDQTKKDRYENYFRIAISYMNLEDLENSTRTLSRLIKEFHEQMQSSLGCK